MKIATTLLLGAAALIGATAVSVAQSGNGIARVPAVPDKPGKQALATPAPKPAKAVAAKPAEAPTTEDVAAPSASDAAPTTETAAAQPSGAEVPAVTPAGKVQEAKNNDAATAIDAGQDKPPEKSKDNPDDTDGIAATVNDESISDYEVRQRVALYLATSGINQQLSEEQRKRIRNQILDQLENEKVQLQEAVKKKITVSPTEVDKRINAMMSDNRFTITQLRATLSTAGASEDALRAQITASIAWMKAVQDEYSDRVNVTPEMVEAEMARLAEGANKAHYHVMEIFVPVDNPEQDAKVKKDAEEIVNQLHQGAPFAMVARQFSQHPTAATGGDIGWVYDGQLAPELNREVAKLEVGMITPPIRSTGGYYVLALRERQEPLGTKVAAAPTGPSGPTGTLPLARLLLPINPHGPKEQIAQAMEVAAQIASHYAGCSNLEDIHKKLGGSVYMNLGDAVLADLSPQIQEALKNSKPGDAATPFLSDAGVELITRCDKRQQVLTAYTLPSRQQVEDELFQNQIAALARRYLRDLRRDSNIQVRDDTKTDAFIR
ncbi:MAG: Peptidylprolyl isomerase [Alphaproteobacteria bacterium]|nr:Peptidylprolyl isomerase [Alphaproteobacteria bacterium]